MNRFITTCSVLAFALCASCATENPANEQKAPATTTPASVTFGGSTTVASTNGTTRTVKAAPAPAIDVTLPAMTPNELGEWLMGYYLHPDPDHLIPRTAQLFVLAASSGQSLKPTKVFLASVIHADASRVEMWCSEVVKQPGGRAALCEGIWMSGSAQARSALERIRPLLPEAERLALGELLKSTPPALGTGPILAGDRDTTMDNMDANWAAFFATGDELPVKNLIQMLSAEKSALTPAELAYAKKVALWSLGSIAQSNPKLGEYTRQLLPALPANLRKQIEDSLASGGQSAGNATDSAK